MRCDYYLSILEGLPGDELLKHYLMDLTQTILGLHEQALSIVGCTTCSGCACYVGYYTATNIDSRWTF